MKREDEFDGWLESELRRRLDLGRTSLPIARYQKERIRRGQMPKFVTSLVAALATKGAVGLTVAALAAGATGAAVVVGVSTGALSPSGFSESLKQDVQTCKSEPPSPGQHGIGACVSSFARQHGSDARENNPGKGDKNDHPSTHATKSPKSGDDQGDDGDNNASNHSSDHHGPPSTIPPRRGGDD